MQIKGIQKTSLIDFPGKICSVIFVNNCNFKCHYCHNPELIEGNLDNLDENEILEFLDRRKNYVDSIVISGGEPCLQEDLINFIKNVKEIGLFIKIDTNGSRPDVLKELIDNKLVDYIAMDIKAPFEKYKDVIKGDVDLEKIRESVKLIKESNVDYEFRTTILPKLLNKEDIKIICEEIKNAKRYYLQQFRNIKTLNKDYENEESYNNEEILSIKEEIKNNFEVCEVRGI